MPTRSPTSTPRPTPSPGWRCSAGCGRAWTAASGARRRPLRRPVSATPACGRASVALEVGCGAAGASRLLAQVVEGVRVVGVDPSRLAIAEAIAADRRGRARRPRLASSRWTGAGSPYPDGDVRRGLRLARPRPRLRAGGDSRRDAPRPPPRRAAARWSSPTATARSGACRATRWTGSTGGIGGASTLRSAGTSTRCAGGPGSSRSR